MALKIDRRKFLAGGVALIGSAILSYAGTQDSEVVWAFMDQSGALSGAEPFCVGLLTCQNLGKQRVQIQNCRERHHFRTTLRYSSTDRFRLKYARDVLRYFVQEPHFKFAGRLVIKHAEIPAESPSLREVLYRLQYKALLKSIPEDKQIMLTVMTHYSPKRGVDELLHKYLREEFPNIIDLKRSRLIENDFLQITNFLCGNVYGAAARG